MLWFVKLVGHISLCSALKSEVWFGHQNEPSYIDLARAKREALDNIYTLLQQNIKSFDAKRRRHRERWKNNKALISKKQLCTCSTLFCTFLCHCFARIQRETSRYFLVTRFMKEMPYVSVLVHFFFSLPLIFTWVVANISHFLTPTFHGSSNKKCLLCLFFYLRFSSVTLFLVGLRWPVAYFLFFCVFLFLYFLNLWTWKLI